MELNIEAGKFSEAQKTRKEVKLHCMSVLFSDFESVVARKRTHVGWCSFFFFFFKKIRFPWWDQIWLAFFIFTVFVLCENILAKESLYPVYFLVGTMLCASYIFERYLEHCPIIARTFWHTRALTLQATSADIRQQQNFLIDGTQFPHTISSKT